MAPEMTQVGCDPPWDALGGTPRAGEAGEAGDAGVTEVFFIGTPPCYGLAPLAPQLGVGLPRSREWPVSPRDSLIPREISGDTGAAASRALSYEGASPRCSNGTGELSAKVARPTAATGETCSESRRGSAACRGRSVHASRPDSSPKKRADLSAQSARRVPSCSGHSSKSPRKEPKPRQRSVVSRSSCGQAGSRSVQALSCAAQARASTDGGTGAAPATRGAAPTPPPRTAPPPSGACTARSSRATTPAAGRCSGPVWLPAGAGTPWTPLGPAVPNRGCLARVVQERSCR